MLLSSRAKTLNAAARNRGIVWIGLLILVWFAGRAIRDWVRGPYLVVHCQTESGDPLDQVDFSYRYRGGGGGIRDESVDHEGNGTHRVHMGTWFDGENRVKDFVMAAKPAEYGTLWRGIERPDEEVWFAFGEPAFLEVALTDYQRTLSDKVLALELHSREDRSMNEYAEVPPNGKVTLGPLTPGRYLLGYVIHTSEEEKRAALATQGFFGSGGKVYFLQDVDLSPGKNRLTIEDPGG